MIEIKIPKEIREYQMRIWLGLSLRQTICIALAGLACIPTYVYLRPIIGEDLTGFIIMIFASFFGGLGWFNRNGMTAEQWIIAFFKLMIYPQKRKYQYEPVFSVIREEIKTEIKNAVKKGGK